MAFNPGGGGGVAGATDVALSNPVDNQVLSYDAAVSKWRNELVEGEPGPQGPAGAGVIYITDGSAVPAGTPPGLVVRPEAG